MIPPTTGFWNDRHVLVTGATGLVGSWIVKDLLAARTREGMTVFMSTHTLAMAEEMADRVGIMVRGQLRFLGTVAELREQMALESTTLEQLYLEVTSPRGRLP